DVPPEPIRAALRQAGVVASADASVQIVMTDNLLRPELELIDHAARAMGRSWLLVRPVGERPLIGPFFSSDDGPCWSCLAARVRQNRPVEVYLEQQTGEMVFPPMRRLPARMAAAAAMAANALDDPAALRASICELRPDLTTRIHAVTRRPQCASCGDPALVATQREAEVRLQERPRAAFLDGGYRAVHPEVILDRLEAQISPLTGIVAHLKPSADRDHPLRPVFEAGYFLAPRRLRRGPQAFEQLSMGKGRSRAQSRASAVCEAIERWSTVHQGDESFRRDRAAALGDTARTPPTLLGFSEAQYAARVPDSDPNRAIPLPFEPDVEIDWTPAWSLTHGCRRYLPAAYCYARYPVPPQARFCFHNPNGTAAGGNLEEAVLQGFLELVERDGTAIWWYNQLSRPAVDLGSFQHVYFTRLQDHYRQLGWTLWVLDLTTDLQIPTFVALAQHGETGDFCIGLGCHLEAWLGVQRALTELNQLFDPSRPQHASWLPDALRQARFLFPEGTRTADAFASVSFPDIRDAVEHCVARVAALGMETIVIDHSRPDAGLSVAQVVVPGLRHFWPRLGPGRLYDVPVKMGWRDAPHHESTLNPHPLYL
ncbi:MAG: TOMM precursor leader peptide-binding protein, partial [Myxococcota bacterium]